MTCPKIHLINPDGGTYLVCSRFVRGAFLFGVDETTGKGFSHRRDWIENRILALSKIFTISVYAYAVRRNHYYIVLRMDVITLSDKQVADRWLQLSPGRKVNNRIVDALSARRSALLGDEIRLAEVRSRLRSLSWFMRFINEPLARFANKEDDCTGRFWEGRFKSHVLLDEASVPAGMVYVDLNPV
jgi:hypothetical protein